MRVTMDRDDPDFIGKENYGRFRVKVNGDEVKAVEADDRAGYAVVHARDADGHYVLNSSKTEVLTERLQGQVEIIDTRV